MITFTVVATFWWDHQTIFRHYFVANRVMVLVNFVALAAVLLQVFSLQLWLHFGPSQADGVAGAQIYFGIFAVTFAMVALLLGLGTAYRWNDLDSKLRRDGVARTVRIFCNVLGVAIGIGFSTKWLLSIPYWALGIPIFARGHENVVVFPGSIFLGLLAGDVVGQILAAIVKRAIPLRKDDAAAISP